MLVVFENMHRLHRLKAAKDGKQAINSPLKVPRSSFAATAAAKKITAKLLWTKNGPLTAQGRKFVKPPDNDLLSPNGTL